MGTSCGRVRKEDAHRGCGLRVCLLARASEWPHDGCERKRARKTNTARCERGSLTQTHPRDACAVALGGRVCGVWGGSEERSRRGAGRESECETADG